MKDLENKIALVTGAASGFGLETSRLLASYGVTVIMTDVNESLLHSVCDESCPGAVAVKHDVTSETDWDAVYAFIAERYGRLNILVNNAGIMRPEPFEAATLETLRRQYRINVEGVYMGMSGAITLMKSAIEQGAESASIINISSVYGMVAGEQFSAYSTTKAAVRGLTKAVAFELAAAKIRVNCVLPGPAATNLSADWERPYDANGQPISDEQALAAWVNMIPMGRIGEAGDIAPVVAFLASDMSKFMTGSELVADGGYTAP